MKTPANLQVDYNDIPLHQSDLHACPIEQFRLWFAQAIAQNEIEPSAMTLATVNAAYEVSARMVLLKEIDSQGFIFFSNYQSHKAIALAEISSAALVFWWPLCQRQVRITGTITLLDATRSDAYFASRDRNSQIAAIASEQSQAIPNRAHLLERFDSVNQQFADTPVLARPEYWGGYHVQPLTVEFWQGRPHRFHDRFEYRKIATGWEIAQLSP